MASSSQRAGATAVGSGGTEKKTYPSMSRDDVEAMIADGCHLIILNQHVLRVDPWLKHHPGGAIAIQHMVGRDATDEVTVFHSPETRQQMLRYRIGRIEGPWKNFVPPLQGGAFRSRAQMEDQTGDESDMGKEADLSSSSSRAPSPVFDLDMRDGMRQRQRTAASSSSTSPQPSDKMDMDGLTYLDSVTREKISLDLDKYPAIDDATQARVVAQYRELHERVKAEGLFDCNYYGYSIDCCHYLGSFVLTLLFLSYGQYVLSGLCLGYMWHQLVFLAHDAGHTGVTHNFQVDSILAIIVADFIGGLSMGWWKRSHNVHHIVTNAPEHDPDIEHMPLFAVSHRLLGSLRSTYYDRVMAYDAAAKVLLRIQAWTYFPLLALGRFNLYVLSWDYLLAGRGPRKGPAAWFRWMEMIGQVFFWTWFGYGILYKTIPDNWSRFTFVMVSHIASSPLHVQIVLSHFAMSTADLGPQESFAQKMLRTTMDIDCPPWLDFIHGGLQFQAIHHLFPRMPRHNLRRAQKLIQEFCNEVDIPYVLYGFADGNKQVIGTLAEVSRHAAILAKCQKSIMQTPDFHMH